MSKSGPTFEPESRLIDGCVSFKTELGYGVSFPLSTVGVFSGALGELAVSSLASVDFFHAADSFSPLKYFSWALGYFKLNLQLTHFTQRTEVKTGNH